MKKIEVSVVDREAEQYCVGLANNESMESHYFFSFADKKTGLEVEKGLEDLLKKLTEWTDGAMEYKPL